MVVRGASSVNIFSKTNLQQIMDAASKARRQILTVRGDTFGVTSVKFIDIFLRNLLFFSRAKVRPMIYIVMMSREQSANIANFRTPGIGFIMFWYGHIIKKMYTHHL